MCERERILFKLHDLYTEIEKLRSGLQSISQSNVSDLRNRLNATQKLVEDFYGMVAEIRATANGAVIEVNKTDKKVENKLSEFVNELKKQTEQNDDD